MSFPVLLSTVLLFLLASCSSGTPEPPGKTPQTAANSGNRRQDEFQTVRQARKLPVSNPELPRNAVRAQKERIAADLPFFRLQVKSIRKDSAREERLQRLWLKKQHEFELIPKIISPETGQEIERFRRHYRWMNRNESFYALANQADFSMGNGTAHNIRALHSLHQLLEKCGIQLLVMLIPDADQIARRAFLPETSRLGDPAALQCAAMLLEYGIEVICPDDAVLANMHRYERLFCYPDPRPETGLWKILADLAAERLERFGKKAFIEPEPSHFAERFGKTAFGNNYRWPEGVHCGDHKNGETVQSLQVFRNGSPFRPDPKSKILVIGGSDLHFPGPGHSFSGQLSMRLKYPVDELTPGGKVWFQNLAADLNRNLVRYLAGKQVCLLLVSPRMLARNVFPDIREQMELFIRLSSCRPVHRFPLPETRNDIQPVPPVSGDRLAREKIQWNREWTQLARTASTAAVRIEQDERPQFFQQLELPAKRTDKPFILVVRTAGYPGQSNTLLVNGKKIPLLNNTDKLIFRPAAAVLPPETRSVRLEIGGQRENLLLIRDIQLYQ